VAVNIVTIAADLEGGVAAAGLIFHQDRRWFVVPLSIVLLAGLLFVGYHVMQRALKYLLLCLLAYAVAAVLARPDRGAVAAGSGWGPAIFWPVWRGRVFGGGGAPMGPPARKGAEVRRHGPWCHARAMRSSTRRTGPTRSLLPEQTDRRAFRAQLTTRCLWLAYLPAPMNRLGTDSPALSQPAGTADRSRHGRALRRSSTGCPRCRHADQNEHDHQALVDAVAARRITAEPDM
jgi:hypothetical protein